MTTCTKGLTNGQCGGASKGKCELAPEKDCGWELIYKRLKEKGQLDMLKRFVIPKSWDKMIPEVEVMDTSNWELERTAEKERV